MKNLFFLPLLFFAHFSLGQMNNKKKDKPTGYQISVKIIAFSNDFIYLGKYLGANTMMVDTLTLDEKGNGVFEGDQKLKEGVYVLCNNQQKGITDFLVDSNQVFEIDIDNLNPQKPTTIKYINSPLNSLFAEYANRSNELFYLRSLILDKIKYAESATSYEFQKNKLNDIDTQIVQYQRKFETDNPGSFCVTLLNAMKVPSLPDPLKTPLNAADSTAAKKFTKDHYWDGVNFWDGRLARTPFLSEKIKSYYSDIVGYETKEVIANIDAMLGMASASDDMTQLIMSDLIQGTMNHRYKWDDSVFIHLFEKFIAPKTYDWMLETTRKVISEKAYFLMGKMVGSPAPEIELSDLYGNKSNLYSSKSNYTVLCFWDPTCHHCLETLPKMDSVYRNYWKKMGVKIFSVACEGNNTLHDWTSYIELNHLQEWTNVYCSSNDDRAQMEKGKKRYSELYDVWYFPSFFVLDEQKRFKAKKLSYPQLVDFLTIQLKKKG
jgi:thiol-disulfide isomerase/thioredoxin